MGHGMFGFGFGGGFMMIAFWVLLIITAVVLFRWVAEPASIRSRESLAGQSPEGIEFDAVDGKRAHLFFLLVAPTDSTGPHLKALARLSRLLRDKSFREALKKAETDEELVRVIKEEDGKKH